MMKRFVLSSITNESTDITLFAENTDIIIGNTNKGVMMTWQDKLRQTWNDNPLMVIAVGAFAATAAAKLIDSMSAAQGRRAYARQVDYRVANKV